MNQSQSSVSALFLYPFRIFFIAGSIWAVIAVALWISLLMGNLILPLGLPGTVWHGHEMIHGFTSAIIAGFLLTAMSNWTGIPAISGTPLILLFLLWLAARIALIFSALLPPILMFMTPLFYLVLVLHTARILLISGNRRNLIMPLVLLLLGTGSSLMLWGAISADYAWVQAGEKVSLYLLTLLIAVIAGRITPAFSSSWLRQRGFHHEDLIRLPKLEVICILSLLLLVVADLGGADLGTPDWLIALLALFAAVAHLSRLLLWRSWRIHPEPLLWILHLGYFVLVLSLLSRAVVAASPALGLHLSLSTWIHLFGTGAIGIMVIGVMSRVALGHTGRPLLLPKLALIAFFTIIATALTRTLSLLVPGNYLLWLAVSALLWCLAFTLFIVCYWRILSSPRPDGKHG
ncbi:NnrS family protein [Nitrincola sp. MINF-07-Sa-05]|uniref:NnrS family protein n=1 Tax=Nitrincola salilacus TaxID=3400273 RepID=UPI003917BAA2